MLHATLWGAGAVVVGGYVLLCVFARRPVTLRPARVGWMLASVVALRMLLAMLGVPLEELLEWLGTAALGVAAVGLFLARRVWLVRTTREELRTQIETACRGLFLGVQEPRPGRLQLTGQQEPALRLWSLAARIQVLMLCPVAGPGKVALLCSWLAKQYPGPVPRMQIVFNRR
jgi:hypothetical protein